jgi:hypothetical protein
VSIFRFLKVCIKQKLNQQKVNAHIKEKVDILKEFEAESTHLQVSTDRYYIDVDSDKLEKKYV